MEIWKDKILKYGESKENEHLLQGNDDGDEGWLGCFDEAQSAYKAGGDSLYGLRPTEDDYNTVYDSLEAAVSYGSTTTVTTGPSGNNADAATKKAYNPLAKGSGNPKPYEGEGELQPLSAMILMSVLYAARIARYDLFKPIQFLAKRITKWDKRCDLRLHQVMSYIHETLSLIHI